MCDSRFDAQPSTGSDSAVSHAAMIAFSTVACATYTRSRDLVSEGRRSDAASCNATPIPQSLPASRIVLSRFSLVMSRVPVHSRSRTRRTARRVGWISDRRAVLTERLGRCGRNRRFLSCSLGSFLSQDLFQVVLEPIAEVLAHGLNLFRQ